MSDLRERIVELMNKIEADDRYKSGQKSPAAVHINGPLALIQCQMEGMMEVYRSVLVMLDGDKLIKAAPDMLRLLIDILEWDGILPHSKTRIRDLIAKATEKS